MESNEQKPDSQVISLREAIINPNIGVDDKNMAENPACLLTDRNPSKLNFIKHEWAGTDINEEGIVVPVRYYRRITGNADLGLPAYPAMRVFLACLKESKDQGFSRRFETSGYRLFKIINQHNPNRHPGGRDLAAINYYLEQWCGVLIATDYFWRYDKEGNRQGRSDAVYGIIGGFDFPKRKGTPGWVSWDERYFNFTLRVDNTKSLNLDKFFRLATPLSQRTFQYADLKIMQSRTNQHQKDALNLIRNHLGMTGKTYERRPDMALAKFKPVMEEWKEKKILDFKIVPSKTESGHKFVFKPFRNKQVAVTKELPKTKKPPSTPQIKPAKQVNQVDIPCHIPPGGKCPEPIELADFKSNEKLLKRLLPATPEHQADLVLRQFYQRHDEYRKVFSQVLPFLEYAIIKRGDPQPFYDNDDLIIAIIEQAKLAN